MNAYAVAVSSTTLFCFIGACFTRGTLPDLSSGAANFIWRLQGEIHRLRHEFNIGFREFDAMYDEVNNSRTVLNGVISERDCQKLVQVIDAIPKEGHMFQPNILQAGNLACQAQNPKLAKLTNRVTERVTDAVRDFFGLGEEDLFPIEIMPQYQKGWCPLNEDAPNVSRCKEPSWQWGWKDWRSYFAHLRMGKYGMHIDNGGLPFGKEHFLEPGVMAQERPGCDCGPKTHSGVLYLDPPPGSVHRGYSGGHLFLADLGEDLTAVPARRMRSTTRVTPVCGRLAIFRNDARNGHDVQPVFGEGSRHSISFFFTSWEHIPPDRFEYVQREFEQICRCRRGRNMMPASGSSSGQYHSTVAERCSKFVQDQKNRSGRAHVTYSTAEQVG